MVAKPDISISVQEPKPDKLGQVWSPATVTLAWPPTGDLPAPVIQISVVAADELRAAQIQAAHDVLSSALLSIERTPKVPARRQPVSR
jgi:hypothetical protein